jgi:hypothetical protein
MNLGWIVDALVVFGGLSGWVAAIISWREWQATRKKIGMMTDASRAAEILPAWYTSRMMGDYWTFGLLTTTGQMIVVKRITAISDDARWIDVELAEREELDWIPEDYPAKFIVAVGPERTSASVQIANIVGAFDLLNS